ncbi:MAG: 2-amino-4-hydroxy-6-hydroxymethyldihydropteridine diphosphokinase [Demequina sp.]
MTTPARPYVKDGIEFDQIAVRGIRVSGFHGVNANEREGGQLFFADVVVHVNTRAAAVGDDLTRTVNYSDVADRTAEVLAGSPFDLIEAVAEHIARELLEIAGVECVDVMVHKPQAPLHVEFKDVTVSIRRDHRDASLSADKRIGSSAGFSDDRLGAGGRQHRDVMDERPAQPVGAVIALGGNIGNVEPRFRDALAALHRVTGIEVKAASPLFRSTPEGGAEQPDYLNAVARIHTALAPRELLAACHGIEVLHGRDRTVPGSARTLDLDIVSYDGVIGDSPDVTLPHPRAHTRAFVLVPWSQMEPDAVLEPHGRVADLARQLSSEGLANIAPQWPHVPAPGGAAQPAADARAGEQPAVQPGESLQSAHSVQSAQSAQSAQSVESAQSAQEVPEQFTSAALPHEAPSSQSASEPTASEPTASEPTVWEPDEPYEEPQPGMPPLTEPDLDPPPPHRPDEGATPARPGVPRRTSFGVLRRSAPSADEPGNSQ